MRILFVQRATLGRHGMADSFFIQAKLVLMGMSVQVVALAGGDRTEYMAAGIKVVEVQRKESWWKALRNAVEIFKPDIVHVFIHAGCGVYPFLMRGHGKSRPLFVLDIRSPLLRVGLMRRLVQYKNRFEILPYDTIFTHSIASGETVIGTGRSMVLSPPGVDFSLLPALPAIKYVDTAPLKLLYIGSMDVKRGLHEMLRAVALARKSIELTLDLYGDGNAMTDLVRLVQDMGAEKYIHFKGRVERKQLFQLIPDYHAGLSYIPRHLYDAAPALKTMEYLACGIPVVATDTAGNRQFIRVGGNGILADEDRAAFAASIKTLVGSGVLQRDAAEFRESVKDYDWERIVTAIVLPEYRRILGTTVEGS